MHYLNKYYKSHTYKSVTFKEKRLKKENRVKKRVFQTHLRADFLERIVCAIWGFTVFITYHMYTNEIISLCFQDNKKIYYTISVRSI